MRFQQISQRSLRPRLEILEDRTLMSTCHVTRLSDTGIGGPRRGTGDLRFCINLANGLPGPDFIDFNVTGTINLNGALPDLSSDIDLQGPGAGALTVRRHMGGNYRIFLVNPGVNVRIAGVTMSNGVVTNDIGGGIRNKGNLTLEDCRVAGNKAINSGPYGSLEGGGIYNHGTLIISRCAVVANTSSSIFPTPEYPQAYGGGIYNSGTLNISDSTVRDNVASASGTVYGASAGGGIYTRGVATISRSTVADNYTSGEGDDFGGSGQGGGILNSQGSLTITDSTISGNSARGWGGSDVSEGAGGGIAHYGGTLTVKNSTLTQNWRVSDVFYLTAHGIEVRGSATITHSTIAGNGFGTGLDIVIYQASVTLRNSIVGDNTTYASLSGALSASGHNLIARSDWGSGYDPSDILNVDPLLGPLANNGGPTQTRALLPGSPAIDAGDNADAPEFDQRGPGFSRIVNGTIDIGAFEVQATGAPNSPDFLAFFITADFDQNESETLP